MAILACPVFRSLLGTLVVLGLIDAGISQADRTYWAFRPLRSAPVPTLADDTWSRTPIDKFVLARLRAAGIAPNPPATKPVLIRRLCLDLTGLPPTPTQLRRSLLDAGRQLLASPGYGERQAQAWLDVVRFAESSGYEEDFERPHAFRYRDAVIRAFDRNTPYDAFVRNQIAGDECEPESADATALTGFLAAGPTLTNEKGPRVRYEKIDDILSTIGSAFLGMSFGCARCHDHKSDPIPLRDYYRMAGVFITCDEKDVALTRSRRQKRAEVGGKIRALSAKANAIDARVKRRLAESRGRRHGLTQAQIEVVLKPRNVRDPVQGELLKRYSDLILRKPQIVQAYTAAEREELAALEAAGRDMTRWFEASSGELVHTMVERSAHLSHNYLLRRGDHRTKGGKLRYGFPTALMSTTVASRAHDRWKRWPTTAPTPGVRRAFALWLTDLEHGAGALLARVFVNRVWQQHFGRGLVTTANNFGTTGAAPSHPRLLEWLAHDFVAHGWDIRRLHIQILASAVYQQDRRSDPKRLARDPDNRLLWRWRPRRLSAEGFRDSLLQVSGRLNRERFGPSVKCWIPPAALRTSETPRWPTVIDGPETWRRSIYLFQKRSVRVPLLVALDAPDATASCARRAVTTTPTAALMLMNNQFVRQQAQALAERVRREVVDGDAGSTEARIRWLYQHLLGRAPDATEFDLGRRYLAGGDRRLPEYCQVLALLNEFVSIE